MIFLQNGRLSNKLVSKILNVGHLPIDLYTMALASNRVVLVSVNKQREMEQFRRTFSELILTLWRWIFFKF
jgi:hypothetical protein